MANIATIKQAINLLQESGCTAPPYIHGHRGLGKSSIVRQLCEEKNWGFIDLRLAQVEASDIRGLPDKIDGRTHFLPPSDMPIGDMSPEAIDEEFQKALGMSFGEAKKAYNEFDVQKKRIYQNTLARLEPRFQHGILFLDEVNRAADDVMQAIFQLVLDRRVGQYVLPPGWHIVAAGNFNKGYNTNGFNDPAMINRFCHLVLSTGESTVEEWVNYISEQHGALAANVVEFATQNTTHLDGKIEGELGLTIQPSRRSWENMIRLERCRSKYSTGVFLEVAAGMIGRELAISYTQYSCPVKPRDIIKNGVKSYADALRKLSRSQLVGLSWGMVSYCRESIDTEEIANVCLDLAEFLLQNCNDKDVVVGYVRACAGSREMGEEERQMVSLISNPKLAKQFSMITRKKKKTFFDYLVDREKLHDVIGRTAWGIGD